MVIDKLNYKKKTSSMQKRSIKTVCCVCVQQFDFITQEWPSPVHTIIASLIKNKKKNTKLQCESESPSLQHKVTSMMPVSFFKKSRRK